VYKINIDRPKIKSEEYKAENRFNASRLMHSLEETVVSVFSCIDHFLRELGLRLVSSIN